MPTNRPLRRKPGLPTRSLRWWTRTENLTLLTLRSQGYTWERIASALNREPSAVRDRWYRLTQRSRQRE